MKENRSLFTSAFPRVLTHWLCRCLLRRPHLQRLQALVPRDTRRQHLRYHIQLLCCESSPLPGERGPSLTLFKLGAFCGAILAFAFGDKLGRKKSVACGVFFNAVGAMLQIVSWHLPQMIIGRIINGIGMGITSSVCPVFQAECSKPSVRGKLVVVGSLCNTAAFCLSNWWVIPKDFPPAQHS